MHLPPAAPGLAALATAALAAPSPAHAVSTLLEPSSGPPAALLVAALGLLAQAGAAWLLLVAVLTLGAGAPSAAGRACRSVLCRCAPAGVRRAVALCLGAGLALGPATSAAAAAPPPTSTSSTATSSTATSSTATSSTSTSSTATSSTSTSTTAPDPALPPLDWPGLVPAAPEDAAPGDAVPGGAPPGSRPRGSTPPEDARPDQVAASGTPVRRAAPPQPPAPALPRAAVTRTAPVVVRPGDTLWELAQRSLPAPVSDADRAAEWPRWWAANRAVVGDDPDLLLLGQRLVAPPAR